MKTFLIMLVVGVGLLMVGCGYSTKSVAAAQAGVTPMIAALAPNTMKAGSSGFILTVNGSNFSKNAAVNWNGTAQTTTAISSNQVTASIPSAQITTPATISVTVTNPGIPGTGIYNMGATLPETSAPMNFTVN